jgi:hypothetical protein
MQGGLRLIQDGSGLRVINHLSLERYINSVVGAEMPSSWSMEALRAQAVAARSYALAHMARPANPHWHLGDTTRWQAYRGLASVNGRTQEATASTAGLILSYQGAIVESLYAATNQITAEAHGHLGASMSQHGAQELGPAGLQLQPDPRPLLPGGLPGSPEGRCRELSALLQAGLQCSERARAEGALVPLATDVLSLPAAEPFLVRRLLSATPKHLRASGPRPNPFLPWDARLEVCRLGSSHVVLLNKYPVQPGHLLLITQHWQPQSGWLLASDWRAVAEMDRDTGGLWFFNSCAAAGASQPHRHLQLLPAVPWPP